MLVKLCVSDLDPDPHGYAFFWVSQIRSQLNRQKCTLFTLILIPFYCIYLSKYVCERIKYQVFGISPCFLGPYETKDGVVVRIVLYRSCHPFRWWPIQSAILSSLFVLFILPCEPFSLLSCPFFLFPHPSILSSFFDGVPSLLSSFSLVTHPAYHLISFFILSYHCVFRFSLVHPVISFAGEPFILSFLSVSSPLHLVIPFCAAAGLSVLSDCLVSIKI
jgi:hypothetical protein